MTTGTLYVVATPIGNLEDITLRALRVLKEVSLIAAEDTRRTRKLLTHYGISTPLTSCFEHNERTKAGSLMERLKQGASIALVTDAGTPGISDPGYRVIAMAVENAVPVVAVPGPSAIVSALSVSGLPIDRFTYLGFAPSGATDRRRLFLGIKGREETFVFYESAKRIVDALSDIAEILADSDVVICREMTKVYEEVIRGKAAEINARIGGAEPKGEMTVILRTHAPAKTPSDPATELEGLLKAGFSFKDAVATVACELGLPRKEVYKEGLKVKERLKTG
ncbi:MAG: 16S rRNA (cytidine(1402)-2'-O)-methyltransferase [Deltaproteobacteria bacterium]|nr:16S rRNA (cytidine(1402)-2'-O)-methyltransferase [Deltaproteobacteria bacterium]